MSTDQTNPELKAAKSETSAEAAVTKILQVQAEPGRGEVSASTIGRMLGLATSGELALFEGKIDLLNTKLSAVTVKLERVVGILNAAPTGKDLERIDVQIAAMRQMLREGLTALNVNVGDDEAK